MSKQVKSPVMNSLSEYRHGLSEAQRGLSSEKPEVAKIREKHSQILAEQRKYSGYELIKDLLPIADNLERLLVAGRHTGDCDALIEGVELIRNQLFETMETHGLRELSGARDPFDPKIHEEVGQRHSGTAPDGSVVEVVQQGYRMHDRVVRPSQVIVSHGDESS